ncbi:beta-lactamase family protein [Mucilaginibacter sp. RS28]|uniref:Beta-lactamase family protein n=1 Tax=Mucilaginibacter straminoryzae TaxID=2932774 RepID=A0A9X2BB29_9SPHI|nr:serine hydrolase domain-containing protein [Mucilaginibacter straminoryzae]MCJ8211365.1 beta-lactamase family protein [Mucilaginibacter straminoryzae]
MLKIPSLTSAFIFFAFIWAPFVHTEAQSLDSRLDSVIRTEFNDPNGPGGAFMVARKGQIIYSKAFGKANIELDSDMRTDNVFELGSMTKQFTAVAVLMLEEQGKLNVMDPVAKYVPDYPGGSHILIHHLLTHTSGIKDFTKMSTLSTISQKEMSPKMMVDFFKNEPVDFAPGDKFDYNNSGYVLLGYLIELVSGQTYEQFIEQNIFKKIGMEHSCYASDRKVIYKRAYGYHKKSNGYVNKTQISFSVPFASGSLMSTLGDMLKWQNALEHHLLINPVETQKAFSTYSLNNGQKISYGYGWHIKEINGIPTREHGGSIFGFKSMGVYIPKEEIYVIGLSNCDCHSPTQVTRVIAEMMLQTKQHGD